jgi:hypothetical protein
MIAKATLALAAVAVLAAGASEPAYAEIWCIREAGSVGPGPCVFPSAEGCGRAARLNPFGGVCERQPLGLNEDRSTTGRRAARPKATNH